MANTDSFIDEVNEEVRRDRLSRALKRWGWVGALAVLVIVGGAAANEWRQSRAEARAQAFGDAILAAISADAPAARREGLAAIEPATDAQGAILTLMRAAAAGAPDEEGGELDPAAGNDDLLALAETPDLPRRYRDLALLKVMLAGGTGEAGQDGSILETLAAPGAPYRTLAVEMQALRALDASDEATAITLLRTLTQDAEASQALRTRAIQLIVALGASPEPA